MLIYLFRRMNEKRCINFVRTKLMALPRTDEKKITCSNPLLHHDTITQFRVGDLFVDFFRSLSGDLITVTLKGKEVVSFVDQTHQRDGLLGTDDFKVDIRYKDLLSAAGVNN